MTDTQSPVDNKKANFWDTTVGIITKITGLIIAVTGLIVAVNKFINSVTTNNQDQSPSEKRVEIPIHPDSSSEKSSTVASIIKISGYWNDVNNLSNGSHITQEGNSFQFDGWGTLPQGITFRSTGNGTITGQTITSKYTATYQNGLISQGNCSGTVSSDGSQMTLTCTDNVLGTFVSAAVRK